MKKRSYSNIFANVYFWRIWEEKEVDFMKERDKKLFGYEIKWIEAEKDRSSRLWLETYPGHRLKS